MMDEMDLLKLDYEQTGQNFRMLADIRLKLLAFVPAVAGIGVSLLDRTSERVALATALLGSVATIGVIRYELRNTQLYDATMQRLRTLEGRLGFRASRSVTGLGGVHLERPKRSLRFLGLRVIHDQGLAFVYGAALGAWVYLLARSVMRLWCVWLNCADLIEFLVGVCAFGATVVQFHFIDCRLIPVRALPRDISDQLKTTDAQSD